VVKSLQLQQRAFGCRVPIKKTLLALGFADIIRCVSEDATTPAGMGSVSPMSRTRRAAQRWRVLGQGVCGEETAGAAPALQALHQRMQREKMGEYVT
jgi:hypothetical protein